MDDHLELPLVILVHGAWHGAWSWAPLQAKLDERGIPSLALDLPGHGVSTLAHTDLYGDARHVADVVDRLGRPVVLVGHSYGGAVVTEAAGLTDRVRALVHLAAFALARDESIMGLLGALPRQAVALSGAMQMQTDGTSTLDAALATPALYNTCSPAVARAASARLDPQTMISFSQPITSDALERLPSTYVVCTLDEAVAPLHQRHMAERCTATITLETDHSPFASMPDATADVIAGAWDRLL
jgi:pimeloyl-ACP methyl ester carboxylesterase